MSTTSTRTALAALLFAAAVALAGCGGDSPPAPHYTNCAA